MQCDGIASEKLKHFSYARASYVFVTSEFFHLAFVGGGGLTPGRLSGALPLCDTFKTKAPPGKNVENVDSHQKVSFLSKINVKQTFKNSKYSQSKNCYTFYM